MGKLPELIRRCESDMVGGEITKVDEGRNLDYIRDITHSDAYGGGIFLTSLYKLWCLFPITIRVLRCVSRKFHWSPVFALRGLNQTSPQVRYLQGAPQ